MNDAELKALINAPPRKIQAGDIVVREKVFEGFTPLIPIGAIGIVRHVEHLEPHYSANIVTKRQGDTTTDIRQFRLATHEEREAYERL